MLLRVALGMLALPSLPEVGATEPMVAERDRWHESWAQAAGTVAHESLAEIMGTSRSSLAQVAGSNHGQMMKSSWCVPATTLFEEPRLIAAGGTAARRNPDDYLGMAGKNSVLRGARL